MTCIQFIANGSSEAAKAEIVKNCCPQDFYRLKNTPEKCNGDRSAATLFMCDECWNQQAHPIE